MKQNALINEVFRPVYGLPCWNVQYGWGSFLTLEFGAPRLVVREPEEPNPDWSAAMQKRHAKRRITIRGDWHLWIYCCEWKLYTRSKLVGDSAPESSSKKRIAKAAEELDGQVLTQVEIDPKSGCSIFTFDLGSRLETKPYDGDSDQWLLYEPSGKVFCYRADGQYSHQKGNTRPKQQRYQPFEQLD